MSRTDKDRPWWVATIQDDNYIEHDHRFGECREETLAYTKAANGRRWFASHHWRRCKKRVERVFYCTKREPYTLRNYDAWWSRGHVVRIQQECWTWRCRCDVPRWKRHATHYGPLYEDGFRDECPTWGRVQCEGHSKVVTDPDIPCVCDDWSEPPTCTLEPAERGRYRYCSGGVPSEFVRAVYHRPERARERKLRDLAREYNTYGDLEDGDFFNRQARNSARWDWW